MEQQHAHVRANFISKLRKASEARQFSLLISFFQLESNTFVFLKSFKKTKHEDPGSRKNFVANSSEAAG